MALLIIDLPQDIDDAHAVIAAAAAMRRACMVRLGAGSCDVVGANNTDGTLAFVGTIEEVAEMFEGNYETLETFVRYVKADFAVEVGLN